MVVLAKLEKEATGLPSCLCGVQGTAGTVQRYLECILRLSESAGRCAPWPPGHSCLHSIHSACGGARRAAQRPRRRVEGRVGGASRQTRCRRKHGRRLSCRTLSASPAPCERHQVTGGVKSTGKSVRVCSARRCALGQEFGVLLEEAGVVVAVHRVFSEGTDRSNPARHKLVSAPIILYWRQ